MPHSLKYPVILFEKRNKIYITKSFFFSHKYNYLLRLKFVTRFKLESIVGQILYHPNPKISFVGFFQCKCRQFSSLTITKRFSSTKFYISLLRFVIVCCKFVCSSKLEWNFIQLCFMVRLLDSLSFIMDLSVPQRQGDFIQPRFVVNLLDSLLFVVVVRFFVIVAVPQQLQWNFIRPSFVVHF